MKTLSLTEMEVIKEGTVKAIKELQEESKKDYPRTVLQAIDNELKVKYQALDQLNGEMNKRQ